MESELRVEKMGNGINARKITEVKRERLFRQANTWDDNISSKINNPGTDKPNS